jgi:hypothetical protein
MLEGEKSQRATYSPQLNRMSMMQKETEKLPMLVNKRECQTLNQKHSNSLFQVYHNKMQ